MKKAILPLLLVALLLIGSSWAMPASLRTKVPVGWKQSRENVDPMTHVTLHFGVKQRNAELLEGLVYTVSDPQSPMYGQHMTLDEVHKLLAPSESVLTEIVSWIQSKAPEASIDFTGRGEFITVRTSVTEAQQLLENCQFSHFYHAASSHSRLRCADGFDIPQHIAQHLDIIGGTTRFPSVRTTTAKMLASVDVGLETSPHLIRERYNVPSDLVATTNVLQSVAQFLGQHFSPIDLSEYFDLFSSLARGDKVEKTIGPNHIPSGLEASLDIQTIMAVAPKVRTWFWSTAQEYENQEDFLQWLLDVQNSTITGGEIPSLFSVSYGDDEDSLDLDYVLRVDNELAKLAAIGVSVLFASGDSGVGGDSGSCKTFVPSYPATSQWVTAVGGTTLGLLETGKEVCNGLSGGGFSNIFPRPAYQDAAVETYLSNCKALNCPDSSLFNSTGRAYPDVSAFSSGFTVVANLIPTPGVSGTSAAAPTFAAIISLINDARIKNNQPALGFLNPALYLIGSSSATATAFNDITEGSNPGCGTDGFQATTGWDPSTGWGSPNFENLKNALLAL